MQVKLVDLQFKLQKEVAVMSKMVAAPKVDERATLAQADRVMALEKDIKQLHLRTLIRLKNSLTDKQRALLDKKRGRGGVRGPR